MIKLIKSFKSNNSGKSLNTNYKETVTLIKKIWKLLAFRGSFLLMKLKVKPMKPSSRVVKGSVVASRYLLPLPILFRVIEIIRVIYPRNVFPNKLMF